MTDNMNNENISEDENQTENDDLEMETDENEETANTPGKRISPIKAIRLKCVECSGGSRHEVSLCSIESCALYPFRFGKNPFKPKRVLSDEQRQIMAERLKMAREQKNQS